VSIVSDTGKGGFCKYDGTLPGGISTANRLSWSHPVVVAHFFRLVKLPFATSGYDFCRSFCSFQIDKRTLFKYDGTLPGGISTANLLSSFHHYVVAHFFRLRSFA